MSKITINSISEDERLKHLLISAQQVLNFDNNFWEEALSNEENQIVIKEFLDLSTKLAFFVYFYENKKIKITAELPKESPLPKKNIFFLKKPVIISFTNYKQEIMFGSINNYPLLQYQCILKTVLIPIFCNPSTNKKWPVEIFQDVCSHFQNFHMLLSYHIGLANVRTILTIPETAMLIDTLDVNQLSESSCDWKSRKVLNSVIDMLTKWSPAIRQVLEHTSEKVLLKMYQGPVTEVTFWNDRKKNLEFIFTQMSQPMVKKMIFALEKTKSCHFLKFKNLLQEVIEGLNEAKEICRNFYAMLDVINDLENCAFKDLVVLLPNAMKLITSSWKGSKYYSSMPSRVAVLLNKYCYFLTDKIQTFLNPMDLFKNNQTKMMENVKLSIDVVNIFLKSYYKCGEELRGIFENKLYPWQFPDLRVFSEFEKFIHRLDDIFEIFQAAVVFLSLLEIIKMLSINHLNYRKRLEDLYSEFCKIYLRFQECSYNPLDIESDFIDDYNFFKIKMDELDHRLGILIGQACLSCVPSEEAFKLMIRCEDIIKRPIVQYEFKKLISSEADVIYGEMINARQHYNSLKMVFDDEPKELLYKSLPPVSGILQWTLDLIRKVDLYVETLQNVQHYFSSSDVYEQILKIHQEMLELLKRFKADILLEWKNILESLKDHWNQVVFLTDEKNYIYLNFSSQIYEVIQEIEFLKNVIKDNLLPDHEIEWIVDILLPSQSLLANVMRWYNDLIKNMLESEKKLVSSKWEEVQSFVKNGHSKKWNAEDILNFARDMHDLTKGVHKNINVANLNIISLKEFIKSWNTAAVFTRDSSTNLVDFEVCMTQKLKDQIQAVKKTAKMLDKIIKEIQNVFKLDLSSYEGREYISYLESIMEDSLKTSVKSSLQYLCDNTSSSNKKLVPFYKIYMYLEDEIIFKPSLNKEESRSLIRLFEAVIEKIYSPASEIRRISNVKQNYYDSIYHAQELNSLQNFLIQNVLQGTNKVISIAKEFSRYEDLWIKDIEEDLEDFVAFGPLPDIYVVSNENHEGELSFIPPEIKPPTEEEFRKEITNFEQLYKRIGEVENLIEIESWLILDATSFKASLLEIIKQWHSAYKKKFIEMKQLGKLRKHDNNGD